jgi:hypothetical protein
MICTLLGNLVVSANALAEQDVHQETRQAPLDWVETTGPRGLVGQVPDVDPQQLAENIEVLRDELLENQQQLVRTVEKTRMGAGDAVITAIMPGGLLYAGYRKREHSRARTALAAVSAAIEELTRDLAASRQLARTVAQLY